MSDTACDLATSWPLTTSDAGAWVLFDPADADAVATLTASLTSRGLRAFTAGSGVEGLPATHVEDIVLVSNLIAESPDFWVWSTPSIQRKTSDGCPWTCAAALMPRGTSPALDRFRQRIRR